MQKYGKSWKPRFHDPEYELKMRLLKTHSYTSETARLRSRQGTQKKGRNKGSRSSRKARKESPKSTGFQWLGHRVGKQTFPPLESPLCVVCRGGGTHYTYSGKRTAKYERTQRVPTRKRKLLSRRRHLLVKFKIGTLRTPG